MPNCLVHRGINSAAVLFEAPNRAVHDAVTHCTALPLYNPTSTLPSSTIQGVSPNLSQSLRGGFDVTPTEFGVALA